MTKSVLRVFEIVAINVKRRLPNEESKWFLPQTLLKILESPYTSTTQKSYASMLSNVIRMKSRTCTENVAPSKHVVGISLQSSVVVVLLIVPPMPWRHNHFPAPEQQAKDSAQPALDALQGWTCACNNHGKALVTDLLLPRQQAPSHQETTRIKNSAR